MAANPMTWVEIETFARLNLIPLTAWEARFYRRIDEAVLAAWRGDETAPEDPDEAIPVEDVKSLRVVLKATAARTRLIEQAKAQARRG